MQWYSDQKDRNGGIVSSDIGLVFCFDGGASTPTAGAGQPIYVPFAITITGWTILGDVAGSGVVDILRSTYASYGTTASIAGTAKPTLSSAIKNQNTTLTGWGSTAIAAGDVLVPSLSSPATATKITVVLHGRKA